MPSDEDAPAFGAGGAESLIPRAGFILAGNHSEGDPRTGLEQTLRLFAFAEDLGYDVAGIRQRHLERGISSALPFLAAASQRTGSIRLETDVVPLGYETPFRLAEDFGTVDVLSGGRVNVGISTSSPHGDLLGDLGRGDASADPYRLIERFLEALEGRPLAEDPLYTPYGPQIPRIEPHIPGLRDRVWLGGGSERSVRWACFACCFAAARRVTHLPAAVHPPTPTPRHLTAHITSAGWRRWCWISRAASARSTSRVKPKSWTTKSKATRSPSWIRRKET